MNKIVSLWLLSLAIVGVLALAVTAQVTRSTPRVVTGADLGFRIEGNDRKGQPVGTLVIRINGDWVPVSTAIQYAPALTSR